MDPFIASRLSNYFFELLHILPVLKYSLPKQIVSTKSAASISSALLDHGVRNP